MGLEEHASYAPSFHYDHIRPTVETGGITSQHGFLTTKRTREEGRYRSFYREWYWDLPSQARFLKFMRFMKVYLGDYVFEKY